MNARLGFAACALFVLATFAACGGGGGGSSATPPANNTGNTGNNTGSGGSNPPPDNSSPPPTTSASRFAYVAGNAGISAFSLNSDDGKLSEIAGSPFAQGTQPSAANIAPSDKFLYVTDNRGVSAYSIDRASGALSEITGSPFAAGSGSLVGVQIDPSGRFVYALEASPSFGVWAYRVAPTGALVQVPGSPFGPGNLPMDIAIAPSGQYAWVPGCLTNRIYTLHIDATSGAPTQTGEAIAGPHACGIAIDPSGKFAFVASNGGPGGDGAGVWSFGIDSATGTLTQVGTTPAGNSPNRIAVHPTGKFAYVTNFGSNDVSAFRIDTTGALTSIGAPLAAGTNPRSVTIDSTSGSYVYVTSELSHAISGYRIDVNTGALTPIDGSPLTINNAPTSMTITRTP